MGVGGAEAEDLFSHWQTGKNGGQHDHNTN